MKREEEQQGSQPEHGWIHRLKQRGVLRVAFSYALIAWLLLQIADVVLEPLGAPAWSMRALIVAVFAGFPVALLFAWFFEIAPGGVTRDRLPESAARPSVPGLRRYADMVLIALLAGIVVVLLARQQGWLEEDNGPTVLGVLPFTELGGPVDGYFGAGISDTLSYKLGQIRDLTVLAPSSTRQFTGPDLDLSAVGRTLGATALLEGTLYRQGPVLRINTRLVDIAAGTQLWAGSYEGDATDVFETQERIAESVVEALKLLLDPEAADRMNQGMTANLSAYDAYLQGRALLVGRKFEELPRAVDYMRQATQIDPEYALAWTGLAQALALMPAYFGWEHPWSEIADEARRAAARAVSIDPGLGEAYLAQGEVAFQDNNAAEEPTWPRDYLAGLAQRAVQLSPNSADAWRFFGRFQDSPEQSLQALQTAATLDPRSGITLANIAGLYMDQGDESRTLATLVRSAEAVEPYFALAYRTIAQMYTFRFPRVDEAARWTRAYRLKHPEDYRSTMDFLRALVTLGAWEEVQTVFDELPLHAAAWPPKTDTWLRLFDGMRMAWGTGHFEDIPGLARRMDLEYGGLGEGQAFEPYLGSWGVSTAWAAALAHAGEPAQALDVLQRHEGLWEESFEWANFSKLPFEPQVLFMALNKQTDRRDRAMDALRGYLVQIRDEPIVGIERGVGFIRFTLLAFLGETEAALEELQAVFDSGWVAGWWGLAGGDFDPDYARVVADPRFAELSAKFERRVSEMRESFRANPELPAGYAIK